MLGLLCFACGVAPILGALQIIPYPLTPGTPTWVGIAAGAVFILAGAAVINGYIFGGGEHFETRASPAARRMQNVLGFTMLVMFAAISGWIAFGEGERNFSSSISLPFWQSEGRGNDSVGRAVFGLGAIICAAMAVAVLFGSFRKRR